jgi:PAS domain S-box-containing protein
MPDIEALIFQTLLSSQVPVAIFGWRSEDHWPVEFVSPNVHHVLGYSAQDFLSGRVVYADIIHPDDLARVAEEVRSHSEAGDLVFEHEDYRILDPSGRVRWIRDHTAIWRDAEGRITHYFGYILDSTARHEALDAIDRARRAAESAARMKSEFLANVSHELRTPLTLILGPLEALLQGEVAPLPEEALRCLRRVRRSAERLAALVSDLLDFARLEAGRETVRRERVDVGALAAALVDEARPVAAARGLTLTLASEGEGLCATADPLRLDQILLNLLGNALKFTPAGGRVEVSVCRAGAEVEVAVSDTGPGIPADQLGRIFERFEQLDTSLTRRHEGAGIGLALVKALAERMGGSVAVQSQPGEGARFSVRLPCEAAPAHPGAAPVVDQAAYQAYLNQPAAARLRSLSPAEPALIVARAAALAGGAPPRVVVADDNDDMRAFMQEVLSAGYEVEAVASGLELLAAVRLRPPEVIVCDVMMPEMDGFEVVRRLKGDPALRAIPVILVTAKAGPEEVVAGLEVGADDYIRKPFDPMELRARVRAAERLHRAYLELARQQRDLTQAHEDLKGAQEQLIQSGKLAAVGTLAAGIAHELNNPMTTILLNTQLLLHEAQEGSRARGRLAVVERQTLRCRDIVRTLLDYTRRRPQRTERVPAARLVENVGALVRAQARSRDVAIQCPEPAGDLPEVEVCVQEIETALLNLLSNALDATPAGGTVSLRARACALGGRRGVEIAVSDSGSGIPPDVLPRIFEPFFTTKPVGRGTGLGLALAQRMVSNADGQIEVETEQGRGTTMRMWLPCATDEGRQGGPR